MCVKILAACSTFRRAYIEFKTKGGNRLATCPSVRPSVTNEHCCPRNYENKLRKYWTNGRTTKIYRQNLQIVRFRCHLYPKLVNKVDERKYENTSRPTLIYASELRNSIQFRIK